MRRSRTLGAVLAIFLAAGAVADEGRTPLFQMTEIQVPGCYVLTRDIPASGADAIRIRTSGVTLDLNGHAIRVDDTSAGVSVDDGVTDVTIRNGRIGGAGHGIRYVTTSPGGRIRIEKMEILGPASHGILVQGAETVDIRSTRIVAPGLDGVRVEGAFTGRLQENTVEGPGQSGFTLQGFHAGDLSRNAVTYAGGPGIDLSADPQGYCGGNLLEANTVRAGGPGSVGINLGAGCPHNTLVRNVVTGNGLHGIVVGSAGNRLSENEASANGTYGVKVDGSHNLVERNTMHGNGYALRMACTDSRYRDNMLLGNVGLYCSGPCCNSANAGGNLY